MSAFCWLLSQPPPCDPVPRTGHARSASGLALIEVVIALGLLVTLASGLAQLFAMSAGGLVKAGNRTSALILAVAKVEQLRAVVLSEGAVGLAGYAGPQTEHLDRQGQLVGPRLAALSVVARYERVWLVERLVGVGDLVRLQVQVAPARPSGVTVLDAGVPPDGARVVTLLWAP